MGQLRTVTVNATASLISDSTSLITSTVRAASTLTTELEYRANDRLENVVAELAATSTERKTIRRRELAQDLLSRAEAVHAWTSKSEARKDAMDKLLKRMDQEEKRLLDSK